MLNLIKHSVYNVYDADFLVYFYIIPWIILISYLSYWTTSVASNTKNKYSSALGCIYDICANVEPKVNFVFLEDPVWDHYQNTTKDSLYSCIKTNLCGHFMMLIIGNSWHDENGLRFSKHSDCLYGLEHKTKTVEKLQKFWICFNILTF